MTAKHLTTLVVLFLATFATAQDLPNAPSPKQFIISNSVMWGSSFVYAHATAYGSHQCYLENQRYNLPQNFGGSGGGLYHPWRSAFKTTAPLDAGVSFASWMLRRKGHNLLANILPTSTAAAQFSMAGMKYGVGCY